MTVLSVSFSYLQYTGTADAVRSQAKASAPAPAPAPAAEAAPRCKPEGCDSPRRSPLVRALMQALETMVKTPGTAASDEAKAASGSTVSQTTGAEADAADDSGVTLERALMEFARALKQALRGNDEGDDRAAHGHHRHHHHGCREWGDEAQRVEQLGVQLGTASTAATAATTPFTSDAAAPASGGAVAASNTANAEPAIVQVGDQVLDPAAAQAGAAAATTTQTSALYVKIEWRTDAEAAQGSRKQARLLDAFAGLQQALGRPAAADSESLKAQLSAFLQALSRQLRHGDDSVADATQPGSLISVQA